METVRAELLAAEEESLRALVGRLLVEARAEDVALRLEEVGR